MAARQKEADNIEGDGLKDLVTLGRIAGPHGVKGWVKLHSDTQPKQNILQYSPLLLRLDGNWQAFEIETGRLQGKSLVAKLTGCDDRDKAEALKGTVIAVNRSQLPEISKPGEYYWLDLEGLEVYTVEGQLLGSISRLIETGSNDVMIVNGDRERLVPYIWEQVVKHVDLDSQKMIVDWDPLF